MSELVEIQDDTKIRHAHWLSADPIVYEDDKFTKTKTNYVFVFVLPDKNQLGHKKSARIC